MVALLAHLVQLALILKHSIQIAPHFIRDRADRLVNSVRLISIFKVANIRPSIYIEGGLKLVNHVPRHRVHALNLLRVLTKFWTQLVELAREPSQKVVGVVVWEILVCHNDIRDHVSVLEDVPGEVEMHGLLASAEDLIVLAAQEGQAMIANVLVRVLLDSIASLARGKHCRIANPTHAHEVDLLTVHSSSLDHDLNLIFDNY